MKTHILFLAGLLACLTFGSPVWAMETDECMECHASADDVGEGNAVDGALFAQTAHADEGCAGCHEVTDEHPDDMQSTTMSASCEDCHDSISETYAASAHGENAVCTDCHSAHNALPPTSLSGLQMNESCQECHESADVEELHARWLPEADIHIRSVPCISCHISSDKFVITLYVTQRQGQRAYADYELVNYQQLQQHVGDQPITGIVDIDQSGEVSLDELSEFYSDKDKTGFRLWAMMTPEEVDHNIQTLDNRWDCTYCHAAGPESMENSFVAFPTANGTYQRVPMEKGATLDALFGTPDFYMVGSSRSKILSIVGLLILLGGLIMPIGHGTLRFLTRKNRRKEH